MVGELSARGVSVAVSVSSEFSRGSPELSGERANDEKSSSFRFAFFDSWDNSAGRLLEVMQVRSPRCIAQPPAISLSDACGIDG